MNITFSAIRDIPQTGLSEWEASTLGAMKENIEILVGTRQKNIKAVMNANITVEPMDNQEMLQITANGSYYTISGSNVPALSDYIKLLTDVQLLANDLAYTRSVLNTLISQLRS